MAKKANEVNPAKNTSKAEAKLQEKATVKTEATAKATKVAKSLTKQEVKNLVSEINKLAIETVERGMLAIGLLVLEKVFQGILEAALSRNPYKSKTLQQVCAHADLRVDRRRLGEWVRAAALSKDLMAKGVDCSNLNYSHFAALLKVDDDKKRQKLAADANKGPWTARKLIEEVGKLKVTTVTEEKAQELALPSNMTVGRLLTALANPRILMEDKEAQQFLGNPQDMEVLPFDIRMQVARLCNDLFKWIADSVPLLKLVKKNIALIELKDSEVIDVEANVV